jgi:type IV pilus assembly protein PilA
MRAVHKEKHMKKLIRKKRGFTLIELLVVVLILAILMAVALPLYLSAISDSELKTCRANMQTIANAVRAYQVKFRDSSLAPSVAELVTNGDLHESPQCPKSSWTGYTVTAPSGVPTVTSAGCGHGAYALGNSS